MIRFWWCGTSSSAQRMPELVEAGEPLVAPGLALGEGGGGQVGRPVVEPVPALEGGEGRAVGEQLVDVGADQRLERTAGAAGGVGRRV
jgi:hypothetical protein